MLYRSVNEVWRVSPYQHAYLEERNTGGLFPSDLEHPAMAIPTDILKLIFVLNLTFLVLLAFSFPHIEPGTGSYVVAMLTLVAIGLTMSLVAVLLFVQQRLFDEETA